MRRSSSEELVFVQLFLPFGIAPLRRVVLAGQNIGEYFFDDLARGGIFRHSEQANNPGLDHRDVKRMQFAKIPVCVAGIDVFGYGFEFLLPGQNRFSLRVGMFHEQGPKM